MIMEELYAASAEIAGDPDVLGTLKGEDILKAIIIVITIVGFFLGAAGVTTIADILRL